MASNSGRKSGSSARSTSRKRVVIGAQETVRVSYSKDKPQVESERRRTQRQTRASSARPGMTGPKPTGAGRKISNVKRDERERRRRGLARRRLLVVLALGALVSAIVWGLVGLWRGPVFSIKKVVVVGTTRLTRAAVIKEAAIPSDATLLRLSAKGIEDRLTSDPWVASAHVSRTFPSTLVVTIVERTPAALVDAGGTALWLVDKDGYWLGPRSANGTGAIVTIRDIMELAPKAGTRSSSSELRNALAVLAGLSEQLRAMIKTISAPTVDTTALITTGDIQIFVGGSDNIAKKDLIARDILSRQKKVVYVNVRVVERPTWRGLTITN